VGLQPVLGHRVIAAQRHEVGVVFVGRAELGKAFVIN